MVFLTLIWDINPEIFKLGALAPRFYGLFFALGFIFGYRIITKIYQKEGLDPLKVDQLTMWMVIATVLGARLGHCLFYGPQFDTIDPVTGKILVEGYISHPLNILKIWEGGLASHGAAFAILVAMFFYGKKYKDQPVLWLLDRLVITIALAGCFIRIGNFFNSEILGRPTQSPTGILFTRSVTNNILETNEVFLAGGHKTGEIEKISYLFTGKDVVDSVLNKEVEISVEFKSIFKKEDLEDFTNNLPSIVRDIDERGDQLDHLKLGDYNEPVLKTVSNHSVVTFKVLGVPRHPSQLYEATSCLILFLLLYMIYNKNGKNTPRGMLLGIFMVACFGLRFLWEFLKENQVAFEDQLAFNMGQLLSIPLVICGIWLIIRSLKYKNNPEQGEFLS